MKTVRKTLAVVLCLIMALSACSLFASADTETKFVCQNGGYSYSALVFTGIDKATVFAAKRSDIKDYIANHSDDYVKVDLTEDTTIDLSFYKNYSIKVGTADVDVTGKAIIFVAYYNDTPWEYYITDKTVLIDEDTKYIPDFTRLYNSDVVTWQFAAYPGDEHDGQYSYKCFLLNGVKYAEAKAMTAAELKALISDEDNLRFSSTVPGLEKVGYQTIWKYWWTNPVYGMEDGYFPMPFNDDGDVELVPDETVVVLVIKDETVIAYNVFQYEYYEEDEPFYLVDNADDANWNEDAKVWNEATEEEPVTPATASKGWCPMCDVKTNNWFVDAVLLRIHYLVHIFYGLFDAFGFVGD